MLYQHHKSDESVEDYLETILILSQKMSNVRSIDIAHELDYSKPSISVAMKNLKQQGLIVVSEDGYITLTSSGLQRAKSILERHTLLSNWLISLGVDANTALSDACKMEHDMSFETFEAIKAFLNKYAF